MVNSHSNHGPVYQQITNHAIMESPYSDGSPGSFNRCLQWTENRNNQWSSATPQWFEKNIAGPVAARGGPVEAGACPLRFNSFFSGSSSSAKVSPNGSTMVVGMGSQ